MEGYSRKSNYVIMVYWECVGSQGHEVAGTIIELKKQDSKNSTQLHASIL